MVNSLAGGRHFIVEIKGELDMRAGKGKIDLVRDGLY